MHGKGYGYPQGGYERKLIDMVNEEMLKNLQLIVAF
jgi:hypothetical protein